MLARCSRLRAAGRARGRPPRAGGGLISVEKVRTYNFPQDRITDHRVNLTVHNVEKVLGGELDELTGALEADERRRALEATRRRHDGR